MPGLDRFDMVSTISIVSSLYHHTMYCIPPLSSQFNWLRSMLMPGLALSDGQNHHHYIIIASLYHHHYIIISSLYHHHITIIVIIII